ncbi:MAG: cupin domain-containing protein [Hyphomonas sp.]|uniref:cupin domain-containing protein n=1 Tax=Hyphomonas sp. TaxID=87 RepID=UPI0034A0AB48
MVTNETTRAQIASERIVRYADLRPCFNAFIDTRTPGSDKKENFTIIGPGVSENPAQHVHISERHGFNIGGARQPPGCTNSQHSHETAEVFFVHSGQWRFDLGEHGEDASVELSPGDLISIPTGVFRGFTNIGTDTGVLWAVLGGDDPGRVLWAPKVFELAREHGLVLLEDGSLIDLAAGETVPPEKAPMPATTRDQVAALKRFTPSELEACVARAGAAGPNGPMNGLAEVTDIVLIGSGRMNWPHGFTVSKVILDPGAVIGPHSFDGADVWFVQSGSAEVSLDGETARVGPGDTITFPAASRRALRSAGPTGAELVCVRTDTMAPHQL